LYFDFSPIVVFLSYIFFRIVYLITIMKILKDISIEIDFLYYWRFTLRPIIKVTIVSIVLPFLFVLILGERIEAFTFIIFSFLYTGLVIYKQGINLNERRYFKSKLKNYLRWQK
jgi:hypothetical protein